MAKRMDTLLLVIAVLSSLVSAMAFTGRYFLSEPAPAPKVAEKQDCIAEVIKAIGKVNEVKTACDQLNARKPQRTYRDGCYGCGY